MSDLFTTASSYSFTDNGALELATTKSPILDLFGIIGSFRLKTYNRFGSREQKAAAKLLDILDKALKQDLFLTLRVMLWAYDCRGGSGNRDSMQLFLNHIISKDTSSIPPEIPKALIKAIPILGRWDTLSDFLASATPLPPSIASYILQTIKEGLFNPATAALCAKWMPRKGKAANRIRGYLKLSPKAYRKLLAKYSTTETLISQNKWKAVEYNHVPSLCLARTRNAFSRHDPARFTSYLDDVLANKLSIHANAIYPHDILRGIQLYGDNLNPIRHKSIIAQWNALPDYMQGNTGICQLRILPMIDVSGSMTSFLDPASKTSMLDVAVSLGLYIAEHTQGIFHNEVLAFSKRPYFISLEGTIIERVKQVMSTVDPLNTDLGRALETLLKLALKENIAQNEMPQMLLILSDMQFDAWELTLDTTHQEFLSEALENAQACFKKAHYNVPKIVFWNLNPNKPTGYQSDLYKDKVAMVSGFSPALLKGFLSGMDLGSTFNPWNIMLNTVKDEKYNILHYV